MASYSRFTILYYPLYRHQLQVLPKPTLPSPHYPRKSIKSTGLLTRRRFRGIGSGASPSPSLSMEAPPPGYRRNVGICLINPSKKLRGWIFPIHGKCLRLIRLECTIVDALGFPGGIDESENPRDAAIRELREETGVTSAEVLAEAPYWLTYDFPSEVREKLKREWGSDWKGQAQKWFLFKFTGNEEEINLLGDGTEKAEFGQWSWMSPEQVIELAVDFKKPVYKEVVAAFSSYLQ